MCLLHKSRFSSAARIPLLKLVWTGFLENTRLVKFYETYCSNFFRHLSNFWQLFDIFWKQFHVKETTMSKYLQIRLGFCAKIVTNYWLFLGVKFDQKHFVKKWNFATLTLPTPADVKIPAGTNRPEVSPVHPRCLEFTLRPTIYNSTLIDSRYQASNREFLWRCKIILKTWK